jgi:hypothetical protein
MSSFAVASYNFMGRAAGCYGATQAKKIEVKARASCKRCRDGNARSMRATQTDHYGLGTKEFCSQHNSLIPPVLWNAPIPSFAPNLFPPPSLPLHGLYTKLRPLWPAQL